MSNVDSVMYEAMARLVAPRRVRMADWLRENFYNEEGKLFDEYSVPWVTAPNGPCDAVDSVKYQTIWLQWAARMFKTQFGQAVQMSYADNDPCRMMFATTDETMCKDVFGRFWLMAAFCPRLKSVVPPERLQNKTHVKLIKRCEIHGAWPRGKGRLADKSIRVGHGNEIDKWVVESTTTEGEPLARFLKRGEQFPDRKFVLESTPGQHLKSRVEDGRQQSTNCRYEVPCPHCGHFQTLRLGDGQRPGGIFWEHAAGGRSSADIALQTAYYVCIHCQQHIYDIHRPQMINLGVWVHEGCTVDHQLALRARELAPDDLSWMKGEPTRDGGDYGSQLSSLNALFWGWGKIAHRFLTVRKRTAIFRQFVNEDLGETWTVTERKLTPERICERLTINTPRSVVPAGFSSVTVGIDKQKDHYKLVVKAWAPGYRSHTLRYDALWGDEDKSGGLDEVKALLSTRYAHADGGEGLVPCAALIDSGHFPKGIGKFVAECRKANIPILSCKGSSTKLEGMFRKSVQGKDSQMPGQLLVLVDTSESQEWIEDVLYHLEPSDEWGMSIHAGSYYDHQDYIDELMNDAPVESLDPHENLRVSWDRLDSTIPNDWRDCERYAMTAAVLKWPKGIPERMTPEIEKQRAKQQGKPEQRRQPPPAQTMLERPGGWIQPLR